jgi:hypothetical protein
MINFKYYKNTILYVSITWLILIFWIVKLNNIPTITDGNYEASTVGDGIYLLFFIYPPILIIFLINAITAIRLAAYKTSRKNKEVFFCKIVNIVITTYTILTLIKEYSL